MSEIQIVYKNVEDLKPYDKNPRQNDEAVKYVAKSIKNYGFKQPIVVDKDLVIVAGHTRWKAAKQLKMKTVPVIIATDLTDEKIAEYRIADNSTAAVAEWDFDLLTDILTDLTNFNPNDYGLNIEMPDVVGELGSGGNQGPDTELDTDEYTPVINIPQYEITGDCPDISELFDRKKCDDLSAEIMDSNVSPAEKMFLIEAAHRHTVFNYKKIAEYYAHADKEMQGLMEKSALVIIDYDNALKNGYIALSTKLDKIIKGLEESGAELVEDSEDDYGDEDEVDINDH